METRTLSPGAPETRRGFFLSASASAGALLLYVRCHCPVAGAPCEAGGVVTESGAMSGLSPNP